MESSPTLEYGIASMYMQAILIIAPYSYITEGIAKYSKLNSYRRNVLFNLMKNAPQECDAVIPTDWFIEIWNTWTDMFEGSPRHMANFSIRTGRAWWGVMSPLYPKDWDRDCLYKRVAPLVVDRCKVHSEINRHYKVEELVNVALQTLADYLRDTIHCEIAVRSLDEKRFLFHVIHNTLAPDDDENYRVFHGILEEFCRWLGAFVQVDEEASTHNQIVVVYSR